MCPSRIMALACLLSIGTTVASWAQEVDDIVILESTNPAESRFTLRRAIIVMSAGQTVQREPVKESTMRLGGCVSSR